MGGGDEILKLFGTLIATDFALGVLKGFKTGTFKSTIMRWGAVNKAVEAIVIIVFNQFDSAMHLDVFRNGAIIWFCLCEGSSLAENLFQLGVPCPEGLSKALGKLKMQINRKICPSVLKSNPNRPMMSIDFITIHNTGNYATTATAKAHADLQYRDGSTASWHYTVDKDEIWQSYEDKQQCWHAGDGNNGPGNYTSIGIEICVNDKAGFKKACDNAAWLTAELLRKHGLAIDKVVQHNKWTGKNCPKELRSGAWGGIVGGLLIFR